MHVVNAECAFYVGQTRRHIHARISEHMGVSPLIGKKRPACFNLISIPLNIKFHRLILKSVPLLFLKQIYSFAINFRYF